ncbi:16S rRNA (guanine527-N7)-methyltransferase [Novosphingobium chloroacetimidivorans]|uniref:Ribosomal RNA small subunit methyltransferase G n=1 Tax=Novosphingobium chloroacetimidivorans TaxID=1428314 RepID=A0A7W7K7U9_9SPHN|nr:16S rRNA (guanine(527)-N(7))-methyltransferase RsmG [Novosphingobium chloroacetimidivorans]MBB4857867.1 16S rRNA (guanine527-N7)-methyltransferase [Novosphingobium chloroacetimidivorans]
MTEAGARSQTLALAQSDEAEAKLDSFISALIEENERQNLVARATLPSMWARHILDSAQLLAHVPHETSTWLDLGTGAGFPGLVIAILRSDWNVTLVESRTRRVEWLTQMVDRLGLTNVDVEGRRLETVPTKVFDVISARAFAPLAELLDLSARFSAATTCWVLPKGRSAGQEVNELRGWNHKFHVEQSLTDPEAGILVGQLIGRKGTAA